jgi:hypothetical protein
VSATEPRPPIAREPSRRPPWGAFQPGRLVLGLVLAAFGVVWLLDAADVIEVDLGLVLPIGLIVVGVALLVSGAYGRSGGGLVGLGVLITVVLVVSTIVDIPFTGGVGDRTERPPRFGDRSYELAVGKLTVDLTALSWRSGVDADEATVEARVGIGQLVVLAPDASTIPCVSVDAEAGMGQVAVFGRERSGIGPDYRTETVCAAEPGFHLELSVGMGQVEVTRG